MSNVIFSKTILAIIYSIIGIGSLFSSFYCWMAFYDYNKRVLNDNEKSVKNRYLTIAIISTVILIVFGFNMENILKSFDKLEDKN